MTLLTGDRAVRPAGGFVEVDGEPWYRIAHHDRLAPFLMSVVSDTDLWMFLASNGGVTAGRVDPDGALFPYETEDRLYDAHLHSGPLTMIRVGSGEAARLWHPFAPGAPVDPSIERHLLKNVPGNQVLFEEVHGALGLVFRYRWAACEPYGWVRTASLERTGRGAIPLEVLDGLRNVRPFGSPLRLDQQQGSLVDAYKRNEIHLPTGLATYSLTARIIDRAEAAESLRAAMVWQQGLPDAVVTLAADAPARFREGAATEPVVVTTGRRGHYFVRAPLRLESGAVVQWHLCADTGRGPVEVVALRERLRAGEPLGGAIESALAAATESLTALVARADGIQCSAHPTGSAHHFTNVLFNVMRGGVFADGHLAPRADLEDFLRSRNAGVAARHEGWLRSLPDPVHAPTLAARARETGDVDLERLCLEYLPLSFGRRHGDPSRPWNRFTIRVRSATGERVLYHEGNWRDVFQNWEALATSFPRYLPAMIARFVNASTVDGFNPYRITRNGVDWEVEEPGDPWSYIGYWGDHQVVYLLRLLEALHRTDPAALRDLLDRRVFVYTDVPYRLRPYPDIRRDPRATIDFDTPRHERLTEHVRRQGGDGALLTGPDGTPCRATLLEKLTVSVLTKLSNLVPDAGIWMNTQRPEWNDANNALAGPGVSTVTLGHLRRHLVFLLERLAERGPAPVTLANRVAAWAREVQAVLARHRPRRGAPHRARDRRRIVDALGEAFGRYRDDAYADRRADAVEVPVTVLEELLRTARVHVDHALALARRPDGLVHAYQVLREVEPEGLVTDPLQPMLEGQVAALGSGALSVHDATTLVETMFASPLHDPERETFLLYPVQEPPGFLEKNSVSAGRARAVGLLHTLLDRGDTTLVACDASGVVRFHPDLEQLPALERRLEELASRDGLAATVARDREAVLRLYESVFHHRAFTGRSATMFGYEGVGCVYWHMVAKLLLAVQENAHRAFDEGGTPAQVEALAGLYDRVRHGLGYERTPSQYGAFPTDPYSHTPRHSGARQPGMTGQVKEEILARFGELGVRLEGGGLRFRPVLLHRGEFLAEARDLRYWDVEGRSRTLRVPAGGLAFTYCQVPVVYHVTDQAAWLSVTSRDGAEVRQRGERLGPELTKPILDRDGSVARLDVGIPARWLRGD